MSADGKMSKDELMLMEALIQHPASSRDLATDLRLTFAHIRSIEAELAAKDSALAEARGILRRVCNDSSPHGMSLDDPHLLPHDVMVEARLFVANSPNRPTLEKHK